MSKPSQEDLDLFGRLLDGTNSLHDWPEDRPHENGNYINTCLACSIEFIGHKRRGVCRQCTRLSEGKK